jgi:hypothetical protein
VVPPVSLQKSNMGLRTKSGSPPGDNFNPFFWALRKSQSIQCMGKELTN